MSPSDNTVYLITGANRGIGYGLAALIAARPNTIVFAGARDPTAQSLKGLVARHSNVRPVKFTAGDQADNKAAIAEIEKTAGRLDVLIANAGIAHDIGPLATAPLPSFKEHWEVNTFGTVVLFQAAHELLLASPTGAPIFAYISSGSASISRYFPGQMPAYASSKTAANFLLKVMDAEHPSLIAMAIHPGWVSTDLGNNDALPPAPVMVEDSVQGIMSRIDGATKEKSSGRFWNWRAEHDGMPWQCKTEEIPW
ncbi:hypothetical protein B0H16DRAFT_1664851 [Mycena metata]|uniref:NAD(P)-binding protein n=1 Tax=Mycena metata TaxID=1033252 RepID=A0AAD7I6D7_9AGAR|nr:hypothetical protein B0H16DRAFT_1664851 [Mycena metata]